MTPDEFRAVGHRLVDRLADRLARIPQGPVKPAETPEDLRAALKIDRPLPEGGTDAATLLDEAVELLFDHSTLNGHPRFMGYITSSPAPIGILGDFLAAAVNPNIGGYAIGPAATEIERQTVRWIAEFIGFPSDAGGLLVSGGNMANFVCFLAARTAKAGLDVRKTGLAGGERGKSPLLVYASAETHTWIQKATDLFGLGTDAIRWIPADDHQRMKTAELRRQIERDRKNGGYPFIVVGTAGSVSTGAVDPLPDIQSICREHGLWFHVDGAYGALAARIPDVPADLGALAEADSVAVDPHKWLYAPLEAGCVLIRDRAALRESFAYHPPYFPQTGVGEDPPTFFHELGPQNSRGFRALKVWLALRQIGRDGYVTSIRDDIRLALRLFDACAAHPELEAETHGLSIATFRFVPGDLRARSGEPPVAGYLDELNKELLERLNASGEAYVSNAVIGGRYLLRACVVSFRTSEDDVDALPEIVARLGRGADRELRAGGLRETPGARAT
jgi:glutamate/tyrosine decarboxylase-like PLP-dependent enzyme